MRMCGEVEGVPLAFTNHALRRLVEMELTPEEIKKLILEPEEVYESKKYPGDICHRLGDHALAFRQEDGMYIVKTALYSTTADWLKAERDGKLGTKGREKARLDTGIRRF